jgi:hypothetical protein
MNCGVFVNMDQVSGVDKASDKLFMLKKNMVLMMNMAKAGNWKGAAHIREHTVEIVGSLGKSATPDGVESAAFKSDMGAVRDAFEGFGAMVDGKDAVGTEKMFKAFMKDFTAIYSRAQ